MDGATGVTFPRSDRDDPALAVGTLDEFWPADSTADDLTLSVAALHELFGARAVPAATQDDYFPNPFPNVDVDLAADAWSCRPDDRAMLETGRAVAEFQRFADQFHAFAAAAANGQCLCRPRALVDPDPAK